MVKLSLLWWDVLPSRQKLLLPFKTSYWTALVAFVRAFVQVRGGTEGREGFQNWPSSGKVQNLTFSPKTMSSPPSVEGGARAP